MLRPWVVVRERYVGMGERYRRDPAIMKIDSGISARNENIPAGMIRAGTSMRWR
jgi:hypothetical protein